MVPFRIKELLIANPSPEVPIYPLVAVTAPVIVAEVAVTAPAEDTWKTPLPILMLPPMIELPLNVFPLIVMPVNVPTPILEAFIVPAVIFAALISFIFAEFINTTPPVTVNGAIAPAPLSFTTWNLSACMTKLEDAVLDATLKPATLFPAVTANVYSALREFTDPETVAVVSDKVATEAAREELFRVILEDTTVILDANEEDKVFAAVLIVVMEEASEELFVVILLDKLSNINAAEELFVVTVP